MTTRVGVSGLFNGVVVETPGAGRGGGLEPGPDNSSVAVCLRCSHQSQLRVRAGSGITVECEWGVPGAV